MGVRARERVEIRTSRNSKEAVNKLHLLGGIFLTVATKSGDCYDNLLGEQALFEESDFYD